jgi:hypothetical protein
VSPFGFAPGFGTNKKPPIDQERRCVFEPWRFLLFGAWAPHIAWVFQASHRGSFSSSSVGTLWRFTASGIPDVGITLSVAMRSAIQVCVIVSIIDGSLPCALWCGLQPRFEGRAQSDALPREAFQVVDELEDLHFVFAVASSLTDPTSRAFAEPIHPYICYGNEAENPVVENDVGVIDLDEGWGGNLGVFVEGAVAHVAAWAYAARSFFAAMGVV